MFLDSIIKLSLLVLIIFESIRFIISKKNGKTFWCKRELLFSIFVIYSVCLMCITVIPQHFDSDRYISVNAVPVINTVRDITSDVTSRTDMGNFMIIFWIKNILGNLLLLTPLAVLLPLLYKKYKSLKAVVITCFVVSFSIEFFQFLTQYIGNMRSVDIDDLILNTLGAFIGYGIYILISKRTAKAC